jgi:hypothetical protein
MRRAKTAVGTDTESHVPVMCASEINLVRPFEDSLIAVCGPDPRDDGLAGLDYFTIDRCVTPRAPHEVSHW